MMVDLLDLGRRPLDAARFATLAAHLDRVSAAGLARQDERSHLRLSAQEATAAIRRTWCSPEADVTDRALRDWHTGAERVEPGVTGAYRALAELAGVARATAAVIARVEQYERGWLAQLADAGAGLVRDANDALGLISDEQAHREREARDAHRRAVEQASAEREEALATWSSALARTDAALARTTGELRLHTAPVPAGLLPREGRTPAEVASTLASRWATIRGGGGPPTFDELTRRGRSPKEIRDHLSRYWLEVALARAGIDRKAWIPAAGSHANRDNIEAVYRYYGQLFLDHPELQWAGMANMIGPSFAAGFFDLASMRDLARRVGGVIDRLPPAARSALPRGAQELAALADATDEDLAFYETTFLTMQQRIFEDQAVMHEAYLRGGLPAIEDLRLAGLIDTETATAWGRIHRGAASGDRSLVAAGNTQLLHREQWRIIPDFYDQMRDHPVTGQAMTYAMTVVGQPSIPGAHLFGEVMPVEVPIETPGPERLGTPTSVFGVPVPNVSVDNPLQGRVTVSTPLPDGNLSERNDRWDLITRDTLPAYQELLAEDPARARAIVASPIDRRIDASRLTERIDDIAGQLDNWSLAVEQ